jgi:hypothetical protein
MSPQPEQIHYDGFHCHLLLERLASHLAVLRVNGTDIGEFGDAPMQALNGWLDGSPALDFFIDARDVRGASIEVSGEWAAWLGTHRSALQSVTMLTGSRFIQVTAEFVRRFASLEGIMRICTEPEVFDAALSETLARNNVPDRQD